MPQVACGSGDKLWWMHMDRASRTLSEAALLDRARRGDTEALTGLLGAYGPQIRLTLRIDPKWSPGLEESYLQSWEAIDILAARSAGGKRVSQVRQPFLASLDFGGSGDRARRLPSRLITRRSQVRVLPLLVPIRQGVAIIRDPFFFGLNRPLGPLLCPSGCRHAEVFVPAALDRLTHRCHIIGCNGESYRLKDARRRRRLGIGTKEIRNANTTQRAQTRTQETRAMSPTHCRTPHAAPRRPRRR